MEPLTLLIDFSPSLSGQGSAWSIMWCQRLKPSLLQAKHDFTLLSYFSGPHLFFIYCFSVITTYIPYWIPPTLSLLCLAIIALMLADSMCSTRNTWGSSHWVRWGNARDQIHGLWLPCSLAYNPTLLSCSLLCAVEQC